MSMLKRLIKYGYRLLPFKVQVFAWLKYAGWSPSEKIYRHLHFEGKFKVILDEGEYFWIWHHGDKVENELFWGGINNCHEKTSMKVWLELCRKAEYIFDVGANTGVYALAAKAINPSAKVIAFEPVSRIYRMLKENNRLNGFDISCIEKAVSNKNSSASIYDPGGSNAYSASLSNAFLDTGTDSVLVETIILDAFIQEQSINSVDLVKLDVESYEPEVVEGFMVTVSSCRPAMIIEVLTRKSADRLNEMLSYLDYLFFNIDDLNGRIRKIDKIEASDRFNILACTTSHVQSSKILNAI